MNNLIDRSLYKRITLGPPVSQGRSTQLILQKPNGKMRVRYQNHDENSKDHYRLGSEIPIQFKQSEGLESWTAVDKMGSSIHLPQLQKDPAPKDKAIGKKVREIPLVHDKTEGSHLERNRPQVTEPKKTLSLREKRTGAKESEEEEKIRKKGKNILSDQNLTSPKKDEDTNVNMTPRRFLTVAPNINEKSDEFIRRRRATMSKDHNL